MCNASCIVGQKLPQQSETAKLVGVGRLGKSAYIIEPYDLQFLCLRP